MGAVVRGAGVKTENNNHHAQLFHLKRNLPVEVKDSIEMEFLFLNAEYALRFDEDELPYLNDKLNILFGQQITRKGELTAEHITGERDIEQEWRDDMYFDGWILSIFPETGQTMMFVKCAGEYDVTVRAIAVDTGQYETLILDVVEAVEILQDFALFVGPPPSPSGSFENGFDSC